jgi:hypothetical protein
MPAPKRMGPPDVTPVIIGKIRFEAVHWGKDRGFGQNGGYIASFDAASNKELWTLKIYTVVYDLKMESDVQDVFIESMATNATGKLLVKDERGRSFLADPVTRLVSNP